jgi:hypothetical protein
MKTTLVAGSWWGEFGWEIMSWQGYVRKTAEDYDQVVVSGPPGHGPLYADFCDTYLEHALTGDKDCWMIHGDQRLKTMLEDGMQEMAVKLGADRIKPVGYIPLSQQKFIPYGNATRTPPERRYDVLFHFRLRHDRGQERNTPDELAKEIRERLNGDLRLACIGSPEESICPAGYEDARGLPLDELMDVMATAFLVTGPASGPLLLASLCNTPTVSWSSKKWYSAVKMDNRERMTKAWNPFNVPCRVIDEFGFVPPAIEAVKAVREALHWALPWKQQHLKSHAPSG